MATFNNPFALLNDESAEDISAPQPAVVSKSAQKKIPLKETFSEKQKSIPGKPVQKKPTNRNTQKEGAFEEKPEHKDTSVSDPLHHKQRKDENRKKGDRKSHNPLKSGEKKESAGKASWGNEVEAQLEAAEGVTAAADEEEGAAAENAEIEESFKSLADYNAEKEAARVAAQVNIRKPNEGVDESQWKKLTPLVKEENIEDMMFSGKAQKDKDRKNKEKAAKTVLEIEQTFAPAPRPDSERGRGGANGKPQSARGRGGSRGGAARGGSDSRGGARGGTRGGARGGSAPRGGARGGRGGRGGKSTGPVNVMDPKAFPSLG